MLCEHPSSRGVRDTDATWPATRACIICVTVSMLMKTSASVRPRTLRASLMYWSSLST